MGLILALSPDQTLLLPHAALQLQLALQYQQPVNQPSAAA
jgi:hypothetical protein